MNKNNTTLDIKFDTNFVDNDFVVSEVPQPTTVSKVPTELEQNTVKYEDKKTIETSEVPEIQEEIGDAQQSQKTAQPPQETNEKSQVSFRVSTQKAKGNSKAPKGDSNRPSDSYVSMIARALLAADNNELPISGIYKWIENEYDFYKKAKDGWKNSVRHALSLHEGFYKFTKKSYSRGHFWTLNPMYKSSFEVGDFKKLKKQNMLKYHIQPQLTQTANNAAPIFAAPNPVHGSAFQQTQPLANITYGQNFNRGQVATQANKNLVPNMAISPVGQTHAPYPFPPSMPPFQAPGVMYPNYVATQYQPNTISYYPNATMYNNQQPQMNNFSMQHPGGSQAMNSYLGHHYPANMYAAAYQPTQNYMGVQRNPPNGNVPSGSNNATQQNPFWPNQNFGPY